MNFSHRYRAMSLVQPIPDVRCCNLSSDSNPSNVGDDIYTKMSPDYSCIFKKCDVKKPSIGGLFKRSESDDGQYLDRNSSFESSSNVSQCNRFFARSISADADVHTQINVHDGNDITDCDKSYFTTCSNRDQVGNDKMQVSDSESKVMDLDTTECKPNTAALATRSRFTFMHKSKSCNEYLERSSTLCKSVSAAVGKLKISLQYFPSARQLRVSLFHVEEMDIDACCLFTEAAVIGTRGQTKRKCSSKKYQAISKSTVFNECIYLKVKKEDLKNCQLRVRLYKVLSGFRKNVDLGGVLISLHELDFKLDTVLHLPLSSPEQHRQITNETDIQVSRDFTIEEEITKIIRKCDELCMRPRSVRSFSIIPGLA